jgi:hypothetical protein
LTGLRLKRPVERVEVYLQRLRDSAAGVEEKVGLASFDPSNVRLLRADGFRELSLRHSLAESKHSKRRRLSAEDRLCDPLPATSQLLFRCGVALEFRDDVVNRRVTGWDRLILLHRRQVVHRARWARCRVRRDS